MSQIRHIITHNKGTVFSLWIAMIVLRALVPAGYMVGTHQMTLVAYICGDGVMAKSIVVPIAPDATPQKPGDPHNGASGDMAPCGFSAMAWAMPDSQVQRADVLRPVAHNPALRAYSIASVGHGLAAPPPLQTGPPTLL